MISSKIVQRLLASSINANDVCVQNAVINKNQQIFKRVMSTQAVPVDNSENKTTQVNTDATNRLTGEGLDEVLPFSAIPEPGGLARLPYIGTLFLFKPFTKYTFETIGKMACDLHDKLGPVFKIRLGRSYCVYTCDVNVIENLFRQEPKYPQRRLLNLGKVYRERSGLPQTLGTVNGLEWHELRKPLNVIFKRPKAVFSYLPSIDEVADEFVERLLEISMKETSPNDAEELQGLFFKYSCEGVGMACFNERMGFLSKDLDNCPDKKRMLESIQSILLSVFKDVIGMERRYIKNDNDKFYLRFAADMDYLRGQCLIYVNKVVNKIENEDKSKETDDTNLLETLVRRKELSLEQIIALIDTMIIGGTESTARILTIILYDMATNPEIQRQVADEVIRVLGPEGKINRESLDELRLLKACVKESMRLHYPVSSGLERNWPYDIVVGGYQIPADTSIIVTGAKTSKMPEHFPNPLQFVPYRWLREQNESWSSDRARNKQQNTSIKLNENTQNGCPINQNETGKEADMSKLNTTVSTKPPRFAFIPFGYGSRSCIGNRFSEMELYMGLAKVVQKLNVSIHPSYGPLHVKYTPFITPLKPIPFVFTKR